MGHWSNYSNIPRTGWCSACGQRAWLYGRDITENSASFDPLELLNHLAMVQGGGKIGVTFLQIQKGMCMEMCDDG